MSQPVAVPPGPDVRRARIAVSALFFTNGALFANLIPRYPQIKADLGMGNAEYGLSVAAFPAGALIAGTAAGVLVRRFGSPVVAAGGTVLVGLGVVLAGLAPVTGLFALALFLAGSMDAITDVAQNAHGLRVQRLYGRSIINSFHAIWSIGAVTGGLMAAGAIALGLPLTVHLTGAAVLLAAIALGARRFCLPERLETVSGAVPAVRPGAGTEPAGSGPETTRRGTGIGLITVITVGALVLIAIAGTTVEDAGNSWATLYLSGSLHAGPAIAALGYIALVGAQFVGRIFGDRLVDAFGQRTIARLGGLIAAAGMGLALAFPSVPGTILGFAAAGFGIATLVPAAMHEADELPGLKPGTGLTVVSWLMRLGFLLSPPVVGSIADASSLRAGLLVVPVMGIVVALTAGVLSQRPKTVVQ